MMGGQDPKTGGARLNQLLSALSALGAVLPLAALLRDLALEDSLLADGMRRSHHPGAPRAPVSCGLVCWKQLTSR